MATITKNFILTGLLAGKTMTIRGKQFTDGVHAFTGNEVDFAGLQNYLGKTYKAYTADDPIYIALQKNGEDDAGKLSPDKTSAVGSAEVGSNIQPGATAPADDGKANADPVAGSEGKVSDSGNGLKRTEDLADTRLKQAMLKLDPENDGHWNKKTLPNMEILEIYYGSAAITRKAMESVLPGFNRDQARKLKLKQAA